jgi:hypothetical protein
MKKILTKLFIITLVLSAQNLFAEYSGGDGSLGNPYLISIAADLVDLAAAVNTGTNYFGVYFQQTANIALSGSWTPIGIDVVGSRFSGTYDGNGFKVTGLVITSGADYEGLFGWVSGGTIKNLGVEGVSITTAGSRVGGLAAMAAYGSTVTNCYSTGTISSSGGVGLVGGLIGAYWDNNEISNCYSTATVSGTTSVGGLIGLLHTTSGGTPVTNCYSSGAVSPHDDYIGGFVGNNDGTNVFTSCYWDKTVSSVQVGGVGDAAFGADVAGVTGKTTAQMKTQSTFVGWSGSIWVIDGGFNSGYPALKFQNTGGTPMPVELTSFTSALNKNGVTLKWSTATEVNNYGFNVERRAVNSENSWVKIGFVAGHGTSNSTISYSYTDAGLTSGRYAYRLKQIDNGGAFKYSQSIEVEAVSVAPTVIGLSQNYPNPFNPSTLITFSVASTEQAKLVVYNILGQPVVTLFEGVAIGQQTYQLRLDASKLSTGVYFYKLETPSRTDVRRMQLLK